jgi:hypothetical protein
MNKLAARKRGINLVKLLFFAATCPPLALAGGVAGHITHIVGFKHKSEFAYNALLTK